MMKNNHSKATVSLIEDSPIVLKRFVNILQKSNLFSLGFSCSTIKSGFKNLLSTPSDVLLLDLGLPDGNGVEVIEFIEKQALSTKIIVITVFNDEKHILDAISAGAMGYLLKDEEFQEIETSITQMLKGGSPISPSIARHLLKQFQCSSLLSRDKDIKQNKITVKLTRREVEILQKISKGFTCKEIAEIKNLSYHTVATHVRNIYKKLSVNSRAEAVVEAYNMGLL
jgi:DNA-binding NarL/FixJ family response regulator